MCRVDFGTPGGGWIRLVSQACVTAQTFVEIEENISFSFFSLLCEREVEENESSCIFHQLSCSVRPDVSLTSADVRPQVT